MHDFEQRVCRDWDPARDDVSLLVAVSGGPDSVALLRAVRARCRRPQQVIAAHWNHRWRGEDADLDEQFVRQLSEEQGIACRIGRAGESDAAGTSEADARRARYAFLRETARQSHARYVLTAHTADDQAETVLHRILRGTGPAGLAGIPRVRLLSHGVTLVRPLLGVTRSEVLAYLKWLGQPYREDLSNRDVRFTRNRLRHELLPLLARDYNPAIHEALVRLGGLAAEWTDWLRAETEALLDEGMVGCTPDQVDLEPGPLRAAPPFVLREMLVGLWQRQAWPLGAMTREHWDALLEQIHSGGNSRTTLPGGVLAECTEGAVRITGRPRD